MIEVLQAIVGLSVIALAAIGINNIFRSWGLRDDVNHIQGQIGGVAIGASIKHQYDTLIKLQSELAGALQDITIQTERIDELFEEDQHVSNRLHDLESNISKCNMQLIDMGGHRLAIKNLSTELERIDGINSVVCKEYAELLSRITIAENFFKICKIKKKGKKYAGITK
jgi:uncharacterized protein YoxC